MGQFQPGELLLSFGLNGLGGDQVTDVSFGRFVAVEIELSAFTMRHQDFPVGQDIVEAGAQLDLSFQSRDRAIQYPVNRLGEFQKIPGGFGKGLLYLLQINELAINGAELLFQFPQEVEQNFSPVLVPFMVQPKVGQWVLLTASIITGVLPPSRTPLNIALQLSR